MKDLPDTAKDFERQGWHALPTDAIAAELAADPVRGLSAAEAQRRLVIHGPNELAQAAATSALTILARQFASLVIWILILAASVSAVIGEGVDAIAIVAIIVLNAVIGFLQEYRAEKAVAELRRMTAPRGRVLRDGTAATVPAATLVPGDLLLVEAGDLVAADARVIEEAGLETNEAALTGESAPVGKSPTICARETLLPERSNMLFLGTAVTRGSGHALVVATGMRSEFGKIAQLLETASSQQTPLQRQLDRVAQRLLWFCLAIVALIFALGLLRAVPIFEMFLGAISLAVAAIPEGLPAIVTVALALGVSRMARKNALIRRLHSVETLGCVQVICTDKTGTLTLGEMTARKVVTCDRVFDVKGEGYSTDGAICSDGEAPSEQDATMDELLRAAVACNDSHLTSQAGRPAIVGDPTEGALLVLAAKAGITRDQVAAHRRRVGTIAFTSERKRMTVVVKADRGLIAYTKGAPEMVLARCSQIRMRDGVKPLGPEDRARIAEANAMMASDALRVIACARRALEPSALRNEVPIDEAEIERDLEFLGLVGMQDPPRAEAREAVRKCKLAGIRTVMITGDHPDTAAAIARDLGILRPGDLSLAGAELESMGDEELRKHVCKVSVYARVTAAHKLKIVRAWKSQGVVVAMTGDGVNDAPALKEATIGVAMGITGTEVTKEAADIVIVDDNFATIVAAVEEGRGIYDNVAKTLLYLMGGNFGELLVMLIAAVIGWPLPLLPIQLLWINLVSDGLPALALATDPIDRDVLLRPPRDPKVEIISRSFMGGVLLVGCLSAAVTLIAFGYALHSGMEIARARNAAFFVLVVEELVRVFGARSANKPLWRIGVLTNLRLLWVVLMSFALQLVISATPVMEQIFQTQRVTLAECAVGIVLGLIPLSTLEVIKVLRMKLNRKTGR
ncbi:MAG: cation-translocating P-type ATPase [Candidatus Binataceae bacterium]